VNSTGIAVNKAGGCHRASGRIVPHFCPGTRIEGIDVAIQAPHVDDPVGDGRRGPRDRPERIVPHLPSSIRIEGVKFAVIEVGHINVPHVNCGDDEAGGGWKAVGVDGVCYSRGGVHMQMS